MASNNAITAIAVIALILAALSAMFTYADYSSEIGPEGPAGEVGPEGPQGEQGEPGINGTSPQFEWNGTGIRFMLPDGTWGNWTDLKGETGETGPRGAAGSDGADGADGQDGADGEDLEPNEAPIIENNSMEGCVEIDDDWIFSVTIEDPEGDLILVNAYFYVDNYWFNASCFGWIPYYFGDHYWLPMINEVGYNGTYSFNATNIKDVIESEIGIPECFEMFWRVDVMDGENLISETYPFYACPCCIE
jgi:hypothetical protein